MKNKTILVINQSPIFGGGASESLVDLINTIDESFNLLIMIPESEVLINALKDKTKTINFFFGTLTELENYFQYSLAVLKSIHFFLSRKVSLIYLQDFADIWKPAELIAARILNIPIISHLRCEPQKSIIQSFLKFSAIVIANSNFTLSHIKDLEIKKRCLYNSLNLSQFDLTHSSTIAEKGVVKIAFIGRVRFSKGVMTFIKSSVEVLKKYPDVHFYIVGDDKSSVDGCLEDAIHFVKENNILKNYTFTGLIFDASVFTKKMDIVVVPSIVNEAFGRVNIETMAAGKALVATKVGGIPEIVNDGINGLLIPKNDAASLSNALFKLIQNKDLRLRLGLNARITVEEKFNSEKNIKNLETIFKSFIN